MNQQIKEQLLGFINTPALWRDRDLFDLKQFRFPNHTGKILLDSATHIPELSSNFVLGKRMEIFFNHLLFHSPQFEVIAKNLQIYRDKITLGELDFLIKDLQNNSIYHVELVYKFYLYDPGYEDEAGWIGANRKDSLIQKISRLQQHQLPLLQAKETQEIIRSYGIEEQEIEQQVCFKATLFIPKFHKLPATSNINKACIAGYWIRFKDFSQSEYATHSFYAPKKQDWPIDPSMNKEWNPYAEFREQIEEFINNKRSPLVWMKNETGGFERFFVVWW
ncbi:MAG TPA: DUF1853 family protein [Gillisia sp.]|nr:DUF1853 family protein [Gillisia sp.]